MLTKPFPIFHIKDITLPRGCGFTLYKNVLVQWDEDFDDRIIIWLNKQSEHVLNQLIMVHEHEGGLSLLWKPGQPLLSEGKEVTVAGDVWQIVSSVAVPPTQL